MPIGAPDPVSARMNVGRTDALGNHRVAGRYTATPGVAPTWSAATGHVFNGTTQYLDTGYLPNATTTILARFSNASLSSNLYPQVAGQNTTGATNTFSNWGNPPYFRAYNWGGSVVFGGAALSSAIMGLAGNQAFLNGYADFAAISGSYGTATRSIFIGARQANAGGAEYHYTGRILSVLIASRTLSPVEVWLASRQMAYCEQNPDWNAWARRRMYFYAPSAAAGRVGIYGARGAVALPGGVSIRGGNHG